MKNMLIIHVVIIFVAVISTSCGDKKQESVNSSTPMQSDASVNEKTEGLSVELLGNYHGIQPSYFMKNQNGDDMVINGNKISIPSIDYKFLLKENNVVSLEQINLDDNSRHYYDGSYKIISVEGNSFKIECALSDGQNSNPVYILTINQNDKKGVCAGSNEPEFSVQKE